MSLAGERPFTLIAGDGSLEVRARITGRGVRLTPEAVETALGWQLEGSTLCSDGTCVAVPPDVPLADDDGIDLAALAAVLDRPLAVDAEEAAAYLGEPVADRRRALASLAAPDFALPDLGGRLHSLAEHRGTKVLLVAWASW